MERTEEPSHLSLDGLPTSRITAVPFCPSTTAKVLSPPAPRTSKISQEASGLAYLTEPGIEQPTVVPMTGELPIRDSDQSISAL